MKSRPRISLFKFHGIEIRLDGYWDNLTSRTFSCMVSYKRRYLWLDHQILMMMFILFMFASWRGRFKTGSLYLKWTITTFLLQLGFKSSYADPYCLLSMMVTCHCLIIMSWYNINWWHGAVQAIATWLS